MSVQEMTKRVTPLEFLEAVYMNANLPLQTRIKAAVEALPFVHPKLEARANLNAGGMEFGDELEQRRARRDGRLIENRTQVESQVGSVPGKSAEQVSAEHMNRSPFLPRRRL